jgi:nitric-oxide synthase
MELSEAAAALLHSMPELSDAARESRIGAIRAEISATGTYTHTSEELTFGARLAWRNSNRCIGRHLWRTLHVFDARDVRTAPEVTARLESHIAFAYNGGEIRSTITVFAPRPPHPGQADPVRLRNHQLVRYAGFPEGSATVGDPHSRAFTTNCLAAGWVPAEQDAFTPLPWIVAVDGVAHAPDDVFARRPDLLHEVDLEHPECPAVAGLGLKWYAVPFLADMALVVGGIVYPCAPFNGYYMGTEIGARNLADRDRYDVLPRLAEALGIAVGDERTLWRDRAVVELNRAVLYSFDRAGVRIGDHHRLAASFDGFCAAEEAAGRRVTGDWAWLAPPISGALTPVFHRTFDPEVVEHTNFFYQTPTAPAPTPGGGKCPYHLGA